MRNFRQFLALVSKIVPCVSREYMRRDKADNSSVRLHHEVLAEVERRAELEGLSVSALLRKLVAAGLAFTTPAPTPKRKETLNADR
jgi:hypothetical protein